MSSSLTTEQWRVPTHLSGPEHARNAHPNHPLRDIER